VASASTAAPEHAGVSGAARPDPGAQGDAGAHAQSVTPTPAAQPSGGRPAPTRAATLAAYFNAQPATAPAPAVAAPAIAPVLAVARWPTPPPMTRAPQVARVETGPDSQNGSESSAKAAAPDLDAIADHVLERLRHELRDGRERLGYLLDDLR
jgi:hypothetical protein